jgi:hypothetical protein
MAARMTRRRPDGRYQVKVTTPDGPADMNLCRSNTRLHG